MLHCYIYTKDWGGGERDLVRLRQPFMTVGLGAERKNKWSAS